MDSMKIDKHAKRPYQVMSYDHAWAERFQEIKKVFNNIFLDKVLDIVHVGSTAVTGMSAKPVIDVLVTVERIEDFAKEKKELEKLGYVWEENYIDSDTLLFAKEDNSGQRLENVHICPKNHTKALQFLYVTEYFKLHPDEALAYAKLKEELCKKYPDDYPSYRAAKQDFLARIYKLAYKEKGLTAPENYSFAR